MHGERNDVSNIEGGILGPVVVDFHKVSSGDGRGSYVGGVHGVDIHAVLIDLNLFGELVRTLIRSVHEKFYKLRPRRPCHSYATAKFKRHIIAHQRLIVVISE